jgi:methylmalonyl-CoA mutase N-terminal domain/subunit
MNKDTKHPEKDTIEVNWDDYLKAYYEKPQSAKSWSGYDLKEIYTPKDRAGENYEKDVADAGTYPFTRGIHKNMFRGRYWTKREVIGIGSPADTHERVRYLVEHGGSGLNTIADVTYEMGLDADHPWAVNEVGLTGVNITSIRDMEITSIRDMETLTKDIPLDKVSWSVITASTAASVSMAQYVSVAENNSFDLTKLRGSIQNDPIHFRYCGFRPACPLDLSIKLGSDVMEFCTKRLPKWYYTTVNMYDLREQGVTAPQEVAFGFGIAMCYIDELIRRGLDIDDFAPRFTFYVSCHIEPLNNIVRIAYEGLAAVLGGVQSLHCCSYDEPMCLPTEKAHLQALRTQQILAYETGVCNVADPLGGSYYVEGLTDKIEEDSLKIMKQVQELGGMEEAIRTEWLDRQFEAEAVDRQKELDSSEKLVVGVNIFTSEPEKTTPLGVQRVPEQSAVEQVEDVKKLKRTRNMDKLKDAIKRLRDDAEEGKNVIPAMVEATKAFGTTGELLGTVRQVFGYSYDPMEIIESPF